MTSQSIIEPRPSVTGYLSPPPRSAGLPIWIQNLPFISIHLACLAVFFVQPTPLALVLCTVAYLVRMFGITAGYHRYFSHRTYKTSRWFQFVLAWLGCSAMQKGPLWWSANHRQHHRHADTPEDPHSPRTNSFWWSHVGGILAMDYKAMNWKAVHDWSRYPELRWLKPLPLGSRTGPGRVVLSYCWLEWPGLGFFFSTVLLYHAVFAVNSFCHLFGSRRYATSDQSRNNWWVALFTLGEGWHNNHHFYQSSTRQGFFWWEIDVSYYLIRVLGWMGLVWGIRRVPRARFWQQTTPVAVEVPKARESSPRP